MLKDISYYKDIGMAWPNKSDYVRYQVTNMDTGEVVFAGLTKDELDAEGFFPVASSKKIALQERDGVEYSVMYRLNEEAFREHQRLYAEKNNALMQEFQDDLAESEGFEKGSEIANLVYQEAWDRGHSAGLDEVANYYDSVADFASRVLATRSTK